MYQTVQGTLVSLVTLFNIFFYSVYIALELILARNNLITSIFYMEQISVPENTSQVKSDILVRVGKRADSLLSSALISDVEKTN